MIKIFWVGKTKNKQVKELIDYYLKLATKFQPLKVVDLPKTKKAVSKVQVQEQEAKLVLSNFSKSGLNILLDEAGTQFNSCPVCQILAKEL